MLQIRRLEKAIEQRTALAVDELDVAAGEVVAVVGAMGSGKSLLIRLLCGELMPSGGIVIVNGQDVHRVPAARRSIGVVFEDDLLYKRQSAESNLQFQCDLFGLPRSRVAEMLACVGLTDQARQQVFKLAKSAQRRLAFARALLIQPALLLLDQPTLRTDLDTQTLFARLVAQAASDGTAVVLTEEDLSWAGKWCTRVIELEDGRIVSSGSPGDVLGAVVNGNGGTIQTFPVPTPEQFIPFKIPARKDDRILFYDPGELLYATSRDGRTFLRTATEEATTNLTLQELESRLLAR
ncbi:MAG TPA: ATP-binding cassette domain-containing protein, partial [Ktedonobacterales bacterium]|nr:ATP-binding cassette domain-containing protein [Ktedonobacterales bacterium]